MFNFSSKKTFLCSVLIASACGPQSGSQQLVVRGKESNGTAVQKDAGETEVRVVALRDAILGNNIAKLRIDHAEKTKIDGSLVLKTKKSDNSVGWFVEPAKQYSLTGGVITAEVTDPALVPAGGFKFDVESNKTVLLGFDGTSFYKPGSGPLLQPAERSNFKVFELRFDKRDTEAGGNQSDPSCGSGESFKLIANTDGTSVVTRDTCLDIVNKDTAQKAKYVKEQTLTAGMTTSLKEQISNLELTNEPGTCEDIATSITENGETTTVSFEASRRISLRVNNKVYTYVRKGGACDTGWYDGVVSAGSFWSLRGNLLSHVSEMVKADQLEDSLAGLWARIDDICSTSFVATTVNALPGYATSRLKKLCEDAKTKLGTASKQK